jgi:hypothetical protein
MAISTRYKIKADVHSLPGHALDISQGFEDSTSTTQVRVGPVPWRAALDSFRFASNAKPESYIYIE